jgi:cytochrome c biogenesis protein CcdA
MQSSKFGPIANAIGLTFSFTVVGILTSLFASVFDIDTIQKTGAIILIVIGIVFLVPKLKESFTYKLSFIGNKGHNLQSRLKSNGLFSQFCMGSILGMIWGPCSGPTLAFAFGIASQAEQTLHATLIFFSFGLGAGIGLISLGLILKRSSSLTGKLLKHNLIINRITGLSSIAIGTLIITGTLGMFEEKILEIMPSWLVNLSVSI